MQWINEATGMDVNDLSPLGFSDQAVSQISLNGNKKMESMIQD